MNRGRRKPILMSSLTSKVATTTNKQTKQNKKGKKTQFKKTYYDG